MGRAAETAQIQVPVVFIGHLQRLQLFLQDIQPILSHAASTQLAAVGKQQINSSDLW